VLGGATLTPSFATGGKIALVVFDGTSGQQVSLGIGGGVVSTTTTIYNGTIVVDVYDVATKKLAWRGAASKTIDVKAKPEKREKNLTKAMDKLFKNFPPPPPKK